MVSVTWKPARSQSVTTTFPLALIPVPDPMVA